MIKLACNYYPEVIELIKENKIELDYVKVPALGYQMKVFDENLEYYRTFAKEVNEVVPLLIHGFGDRNGVEIGNLDFKEKFNTARTKEIIRLSGANGVSLHLAGIDTTKSDAENKKIILSNMQFLKEQLSDMDFISLENVDGNPFKNKDRFGVCIYPDFIAEIVREAECDFLFDISHAYTSAKCVKMTYEEYIAKLPLERLYEIHINGWIETENDIMSHVKINNVAYKVLEYLVKNYNPKIVTLEYGRDNDRISAGIPLMSVEGGNERAKEEIAEQIDRIKKIMQI